jgi:hypothetical protein
MAHDIDALVAAALAQYEALTPEQKAAHDEAQRQSWARGQTELDRLDREEGVTRRVLGVPGVRRETE